MRQKTSFYLILISIFLQAALPCPATQPESTEEPPTEMIDFYLYDNRGQPVLLSSFKGEDAILVVFWALWSRDSKEQILTLSKQSSRFHELGVKVVGVNVDRNPVLLSKFVMQNAISFPVLKDPKGIFEDLYGAYFLPTNILIDKDNLIVYRGNDLPDMQWVESLMR